MVRALKHFKCYLYGQKITVSAVSWLHRSKDPVGQPARWIEVIDTYDITFQHRPGRKHGNADALSRDPCRQCGGDCEGTPAKEVRAVTRSQRCEPGWTPEEMAARQDADPDIGPILRWKRGGNDQPRWEDISPESQEAKVLWRRWERLYLVGGVLHRRFHELEGQGIKCSDSICESTTRTCTRGDNPGNTHARTARPTRPKRIPPSWTGRNTCRTPMGTAWRARIRSGGRNTLRGSNWTDGDGSTSWKGARPTGPTSVSGLCGNIMAGTKARERDNHRDRRPPSAFPTLKAPRPTRIQPRRSHDETWGCYR